MVSSKYTAMGFNRTWFETHRYEDNGVPQFAFLSAKSNTFCSNGVDRAAGRF